MTPESPLTRRRALALGLAAAALPRAARAEAAQTVTWDDMIPPGVPYSEIIGEGEMDYAADVWNPVYDGNAVKLNDGLDGKLIKLPGYIVPLEMSSKGLTSFLLAPYAGACIHVPPPPANQLALVETKKPWPSDQLWDAIWVTGRLTNRLQSTEIAQIGYHIAATKIETYEW